MLWRVRASRELVIRNALVYDGTGAPPIAVDVAVRGDGSTRQPRADLMRELGLPAPEAAERALRRAA